MKFDIADTIKSNVNNSWFDEAVVINFAEHVDCYILQLPYEFREEPIYCSIKDIDENFVLKEKGKLQ